MKNKWETPKGVTVNTYESLGYMVTQYKNWMKFFNADGSYFTSNEGIVMWIKEPKKNVN